MDTDDLTDPYKPPTKPVDFTSRSLGGRPKWSEEQYKAWQSKPLVTKGEFLRNQWADVAYMTLAHAERLGKSLTKKDYNAFLRLLTSAGIAYDKVAPKQQPLLQFNLFNGLDQARLRQVVGLDGAEMPQVIQPAQPSAPRPDQARDQAQPLDKSGQ